MTLIGRALNWVFSPFKDNNDDGDYQFVRPMSDFTNEFNRPGFHLSDRFIEDYGINVLYLFESGKEPS